MISLRKHIDDYREAAFPQREPASLQDPSLDALRTAIRAFADCGQRAVPALGSDLGANLAMISRSLAPAPTPDTLRSAAAQVRTELDRWAESAVQHHNENEREIREIIGVVARAAETISRKDEKYGREIGDITGKVRSLAGLRDVAVMRRSILESATLLKSCVEKMAEEGNAAMLHLTAEVAEYRKRLEETERVASIDNLTQLANRRAFERKLEEKLAVKDPFSLILIDLDDFKQVNDQYGHLAGDDLLGQFSAELRAQFSVSDFVCRWGGDEFAVIVKGDLTVANDRVGRIRKWVLGAYKLAAGRQTVKVTAGASIGVVQWDGKETGSELVARADQRLYQNKAERD